MTKEQEHLLNLVTVILGLGITTLLIRMADLIRARSRVTCWDAAHLVWIATIFVFAIQNWVGFKGYLRGEILSMFEICFLMLGPVSMTWLCAIALPITDAAEANGIDLSDYHLGIRGWMFGLIIFDVIINFVYRGCFIPKHQFDPWTDFIVRIVGVSLMGFALLVKRAWDRLVVAGTVHFLLWFWIKSWQTGHSQN